MLPFLIRRLVAVLLGVLVVAGLAAPHATAGKALPQGLASARQYGSTTYVYDTAGQYSPATTPKPGTVATAIPASDGATGVTPGDRERPGPVFVAADTADGAATVGRDAAQSCLNSFTADTPVTLADGKQEPISKVKVGDKVLATDPETGVTKAEPVEQLIRHSGKHQMVLVGLADGSVLDSTDGHPIWDASTGRFTTAADLHVGDKIESSNGQLITITALTGDTADLTAYNLQISTVHTYYAGTTPVLVHNSCGDLSKSARRQLGNLADQSDSTAADVIRTRGGGASQINQLQSGYGQLSLGELATRAAAGDTEAVKAIKMIKQAGTQGKGGK